MHSGDLHGFLEPKKDRKGRYIIRLSAILWLLSLFMAVFNMQLANYFIGVAIYIRIIENEE